MKFFKKVKDIFFKIFGKARWYLISLCVTVSLVSIPLIFQGTWPYVQGLRDEDSDSFLKYFELVDADGFTINDNGDMLVTSTDNVDGIAAVINLDTRDKTYTNMNEVIIDAFGDDYFTPDNAVITDDNVIYAIRREYNEESSIITNETIVRITDKYGYIGEVCGFDYDVAERLRQSKLSRLHYYDGAVTFAVSDQDGVRLYSLDTGSQALTESDLYTTDQEGTFTASVIPVDGGFLFLRSDGNVYLTGFNEPLGESIYHFTVSEDGNDENPYFDLAAIADGKLYVADSNNRSTVYILENKELQRAFDIDSDYSYIVSLDSYITGGKENLVICLDNAVLTYDGAGLKDQELVLRFDPTFLMYLERFLEIAVTLSAVALGINLIIRKKTLLYKQLIIILPIIIVLTAGVGYVVYIKSDVNIELNVDRELTIVCDLANSEFNGYDFSDLTVADEQTGAAYRRLQEKFDTLGNAHGNDWSEGFVFSVIYRNEDDDIITIAGDDALYMPFYVREFEGFAKLEDSEGGSYLKSHVRDFVDDNMDSRISVLRKISDKDDSGRYYLMVTSDSRSFYIQRQDLLGEAIIFGFLIIFTLTLLIVLTSLNTIRVIKKASATVKKISNGDLSARVNYKSKDELGMICSEVDEMGQNLEKLFDEKDETEKFYYKFVPEKFRELLGKENFTDLALGDAKSCELTVLFCDIRGFSINSEMMTAKENFAFANTIYGKMGPIVRNNNGFVDKYIGDAVMGLFEHADDAVRCGIELYKSIVLDPETARELNVSDINIGIGVHTGMAMVGIVGEEERLSGTVISETVNMSSRLESLTKQYKTAMIISKSTLDRVNDPDSLTLRYLGIVQVAGVNEVEALYEVLDCLPENVKTQRSSNTRELREAIRLFSLGRRAEAVTALQSLFDSGRGDYVTDLYLNYIRGMSDDDKGNVFRFVKK